MVTPSEVKLAMAGAWGATADGSRLAGLNLAEGICWLASPAQGDRLDGVGERPAFAAAGRPFALQLLVPLGLAVGVVDPQKAGIVLQALVLQVHHLAVLAQEGPRSSRDERPQEEEGGVVGPDDLGDAGAGF